MKYLLFFITIIASGVAGCSKSKGADPVCRISEVTSTSSAIKEFSYDKNGKLQQVKQGTTQYNFEYSGNKIVILQTIDGEFAQKQIVTLMANGLAESVRTEQDPSGTPWYNTLYTYEGERLIRITMVYSNTSHTNVTTYNWENGNPVSYNDGSRIVMMTYYSDRRHDRQLDIADYSFWEYLRPKNLLKSYIIGPDKLIHTHSFDSDGKVISLSIADGSRTSIYNYKYECR
ncbi:MAG: hypothetical protein J7578_24520 [Chitinophagaceae bacterium]|nr:hypothetical protein [Chitinophagaceae bacterium]